MNREKRRVKENQIVGEEKENIFSNLFMILLAFFIFLYSFSTVDLNKFQAIKKSLQASLAGKNTVGNMSESNISRANDNAVSGKNTNLSDYEEVYFKVRTFITENRLGANVEIVDDDRGVILQIRDSALFETGKADLLKDSKDLLDKISVLLSTLQNNVAVEGHTDNVPINTFRFETNWDLSAERAVNVVRYLTEAKGLEPTRFSATGYGEYKPIVDNNTPENRMKNRRINILILAKEKGR